MGEEWEDITQHNVQGEPTVQANPADEPTVYSQQAAAEQKPAPRTLLLAGAVGLVVICTLGVLMGALFLPPLQLASQVGCQTVTTAVNDDSTGLTVVLREGERARVCLDAIPRVDFLQGEPQRSFRGARSNLPNFLNMVSPMYVLEKRGPGSIAVEIPIPEGANSERLDLYAWDASAEEWVFVPSEVNAERGVLVSTDAVENVAAFEAEPTTPLITTVLESGQTLDEERATLLNMAFPTGLSLRTDGAIDGQLAGGWSLGAGYAVVPLVTAEQDAASAMLADPAAQAIHIEDLLNIVNSTQANGIALAYQPGDWATYNAFIGALNAELEAAGKLLVLVVEAPTTTGAGWEASGPELAAAGREADLVVMDAGSNPQNFAIDGPAYEALSTITRYVPRQRVLFMMDATSMRINEEDTQPVSYAEALTQLGQVEPETEIGENVTQEAPLSFELSGQFSDFAADQTTGAYRFTTADGSRVWVVTANTVRARLDIASAQAVGGMVVGGLFDEGSDQGLTKAVNEFKARNVSSIPSQLTMQWTVSQNGETILTETLSIGTPFVWQPSAPGDYKINGDVVGSSMLDRGSVTVKVAEASTPAPTAQPAQQPQPSNPDTPTTTPPPADDPPSTPPPSVGGGGGDGGAFELGAQVPNAMVHVGKMQSAGMTWVKFQMKYGQVGADAAGSYVAAGRSAGFKVLLSVTGVPYPDSINYAGAVEYMGQVASYQPDAIEVWNEQNYVFEWPAGQIDGKAYVDNLLAPSFNAIKSASPSTLVIVGAPTPTGINDPNIAIADNIYIQQMAEAGAAQYANCLGVHYNAGATSAYAREGHPGGGHHSWYYQPSLEVYYNAMGGALPLCITEIGYVTDEGFDSTVPDNFAWARDTTVAQQAQWLGEAKAIARSKGYVRMMIVFNVGFTTWTPTDPQAGYSIVRPDGSCPACSTLAGS